MNEIELAKDLGITRTVLADMRKEHLERPVHWDIDGRQVVYTIAGVYAVKAHMGVDTAEPDLILKKPPPARLRVTGKPGINKRLVYARMLVAGHPEGPQLAVRVKSNVNFVAGMDLTAGLVNENLWSAIGRCPRRKGKW